MATYALVTNDTFTRTLNTAANFSPQSRIGVLNNWLDVKGLTYSITSNQLIATAPNATYSWCVRQQDEWARDSLVVVTQAVQATVTGFGAVVRVVGQSGWNEGYVAELSASGVVTISKVVVGSAASNALSGITVLHTGTAQTYTAANGIIMLFSAVNLLPGTTTLTVTTFTSAAGANQYSGNPASPGTPIDTQTVTDTTQVLQFAGGMGCTALSTQQFTQIETYAVTQTFSATTSTGLALRPSTTGNVVTLTGIGTAWTGGTVFTLSSTGAQSAASITNITVTSGTTATITISTGPGGGTIVIADPTTANSTNAVYVTPPVLTIANIGDSLSFNPYGPAYATIQENSAWIMAQRLNNLTEGVNLWCSNTTGVSGTTTSSWLPANSPLNRPYIIALNPTVLTVLLGSNDCAASVSAATYGANILAIVNDYLANTTAKLILFCPPPRYDSGSVAENALLLAYQAQLAAVPALSNVPARVFFNAQSLLPWAHFSLHPEEYNTDGLHPNGNGMEALGHIFAHGTNLALNPVAPSGGGGGSTAFPLPVSV